MKTFIFSITFGFVICLAYWAYQENIKTQAAIEYSKSLQKQIGQTRATLNVLRAEWAYLNRPQRLIHLANLGFEQLRLAPVRAENFGVIDQIEFRHKNVNEQLLNLTAIEVAKRGDSNDNE